MSHVREDEEREARILFRLEVHIFALGERSEDQRNKVIAASQAHRTVDGARRASRGATQELDKLVARDKTAWLKLADTWNTDTSDFYSLDPVRHNGLDRTLLEENPYERFRLQLHDEVNVPTSALLFFPDEFGRWSVGHDLQRLIGAELERRAWRSGQRGTHDRYAAILTTGHTLDLVWLGPYWLDLHNLTRDLAGGPELFRLDRAKKSA